MNDDALKQVLHRADRVAGPPRPVTVDARAIERRAGAARAHRTAGWTAAVAAAAVLGICAWLGLPARREGPGPAGQGAPVVTDAQKIARLEAEVRQLRASTDRMLALLQEAAQQRDRDRRVAELRKELAAIPDPTEQARGQVSQAAERMVHEADRLWLGQRQRRLATAQYRRVIDLFPDTEWASVARQRLTQITENKLKGADI